MMSTKFILAINVIVFACLAAVVSAAYDPPVLDADIVHKINTNPMAGWTAGFNERFLNVTDSELRKMLGTFISPDSDAEDYNDHFTQPSNAPNSFDSRDKWPNCIHAIRNQERCGSCWAFSASEVMSDRLCIVTSGSVNKVLSPQYMLSCDKKDYGCRGGRLPTAWEFLKNTGIPTDDCVPYQSGQGHVPPCPNQCKNGQSISSSNLYTAASSQHIKQIPQMESNIYNHGPVQAAFKVYADFMHYTGGVYKHTHGSYKGGHAIKIIGWGKQSGTPYWLVANSWGKSWGLSGYFKILKGQNECGIESNVFAGHPNANTDYSNYF